ncbi:unnamed protein product [Somion occarium]|uniref:F-box domain-containing protein n=1 Tax=Somion occarium TaxID=3059160 RepID=A0ABP1CK00_9APHY
MSGPERIASHMRTLLQELSSPVLDRQLSLLFPGDMRSWIAQQRSYAFECTRLLNHLHNTTAPVYRLPTEALVNIFAIAITLPGSYTRELVLLTHVCHWWRDVALGASTLWTRIDPTCYCRLFLERSGNAPLSLDWYQEDIFSRVVTTIQPHILRFTSIKLTCRMKALKTFLGLLERYPPPMLQAVYLTCCGGYQIPEEPSIAFPTHGGSLGFSLASLTLIGLFICWESPIYDKLKHLHLIAESAIQPVPSMNVLLDVLERSPDLVTFRMLWRGPSLATLATTYLEPRHTVELARCRSIELQFPGIADVAHLLAHLRLPEFTHITISHINSTPIRDELLNILPRNPDLKPSNAVTQLQLRCANSDDVYNVSASGNGDHTGSPLSLRRVPSSTFHTKDPLMPLKQSIGEPPLLIFLNSKRWRWEIVRQNSGMHGDGASAINPTPITFWTPSCTLSTTTLCSSPHSKNWCLEDVSSRMTA